MYWNVLQHWEPLKIPCASVVWCWLLHNNWWILDDIGSQRIFGSYNSFRGRGRETPMTQSAKFSWWTATTCTIPIDYLMFWNLLNFPSKWEDDSSYVIIYPHIPYICILYYIILNYTILYYIILNYIILYYIYTWRVGETYNFQSLVIFSPEPKNCLLPLSLVSTRFLPNHPITLPIPKHPWLMPLAIAAAPLMVRCQA